MAVRTSSELIEFDKMCCHIDVVTQKGYWIHDDPREWYESLMRTLNARVNPDDAILSVTLSGWEDIPGAVVTDLTIIPENLIATYTCDVFITPSTIGLRHPKTAWGYPIQAINIEDRLGIWDMGIWTHKSEFQIDISEYGGSYKVSPWRRHQSWLCIPPRQRMTCRHPPIVPNYMFEEEEKVEVRRSKRLRKD